MGAAGPLSKLTPGAVGWRPRCALPWKPLHLATHEMAPPRAHDPKETKNKQLCLESDNPSFLHMLLITQTILANVEETIQECACQEVGVIATVSKKNVSFHFVS